MRHRIINLLTDRKLRSKVCRVGLLSPTGLGKEQLDIVQNVVKASAGDYSRPAIASDAPDSRLGKCEQVGAVAVGRPRQTQPVAGQYFRWRLP